MKPNWQRLGFDSREQSIKFALAKLYERRKIILSKGLGGAWDSKHNKHGEIPELLETTIIIGNRVLKLTPKGFENENSK